MVKLMQIWGGIYTIWYSDTSWQKCRVVSKSLFQNCSSRFELMLLFGLPFLQKLMDLKNLKLWHVVLEAQS